jgi:DNA-binding NarL/FixJ family response regulator
MTQTRQVSVLLVEDNQGDADYIRRELSRSEETIFGVDHVEWLNSAITAIENGSYDVVLLDLSLPDSTGIDTVVKMREANARIPIIVMTGHDDMNMAIQCVRYDAQDYVIKSEAKARHLERSILQAIARVRKRRNSQQMLRVAMESFTSPDDSTTLALLRGYVQKLGDWDNALMDYIRRNAPAHMDNIESLRERFAVSGLISEMSSTIDAGHRKERDTKPPRRISDEASVTVANLKPVTDDDDEFPMEDEDDAHRAIAEALEELR